MKTNKTTLRLRATLNAMKNPPPSFYDVMVKRLSKKKADRIVETVRDLLKYRGTAGFSDLWNPDYCNAFGVMQGVAYALGYKSAAITTRNDQPGYLFDQILKECPCKPSNR